LFESACSPIAGCTGKGKTAGLTVLFRAQPSQNGMPRERRLPVCLSLLWQRRAAWNKFRLPKT